VFDEAEGIACTWGAAAWGSRVRICR